VPDRALHLAFDLRIADAPGGERSGLGRYAVELARELPRARPGWELTIFSSRPELLEPPSPAPRTTRWPTRSPASRVSWLHLGSAFEARPRPDVWFTPAAAFPIWWRGPTVAAVHDLVPVLMPERYRGRLNAAHAGWALRRAARRADRVLCGSSATRDLLVERLGADPARLRVTPYGVAATFLSAERGGGGAGDGFLLFVGTLEARKGLEVLHEALGAANRAGAGLRLLAVGAPGWKTGELVSRLRADPAVELVEDASDEEVARLYSTARALVYPSRMEGFGLPVAEAIAVGCPVIASDLPPIREFAGEVPRYVPAGDAAALTAAIEEVAANPAHAEERAARGRGQVAGLRWASVAEAVAAEIEAAVGKAPPR
jgi:glycosyltransferase involved in cell wall biosynthesis